MAIQLHAVSPKSQSHHNGVKVSGEGSKGTKVVVFEGPEFQNGFGASFRDNLRIAVSSFELVKGVLVVPDSKALHQCPF